MVSAALDDTWVVGDGDFDLLDEQLGKISRLDQFVLQARMCSRGFLNEGVCADPVNWFSEVAGFHDGGGGTGYLYDKSCAGAGERTSRTFAYGGTDYTVPASCGTCVAGQAVRQVDLGADCVVRS